MRTPRRPRTTALLAATVAALAVVAGCARIPTDGAVRDGAAELEQASEIGFIPAGPTPGASPDEIVRGFLTQAAAGPTSAGSFAAAQEFVTRSAWTGWDRYARVLVLDGEALLDSSLAEEPADEEATDAEVTTAVVTARANVVATLDENGVYTEEARPSPEAVTFELTRQADGEWRISQLEDGLMLSTAFFGQAFHLTSLYFPTPDLSWWVPDVRWFPRQTWRTDATSQILAGPPEWLADSTVTVIPEGTTLAIDAVTVGDDGTIDVSLTSTITQATSQERALALAQLEATLVEGGEGRDVVLSDRTSPLVVPESAVVELPRPRTLGAARALTADGLQEVVGHSLEDADLAVSLEGLDPTALAVGSGDSPVVVRDGKERIVRVSGDQGQTVLMSGTNLVAPSVDRFDAVWSAQGDELLVALASGQVQPVDVSWLADRAVLSVRVSPEGARIAVVSSGTGGRSVHVAGIQRDADGVPTGLSDPVQVGAPVSQAALASWQEGAVLAILGMNNDGDRILSLAGVGGQAGTGGQTRTVTGVTGPRWVTSSVGTGAMLVLDGDGTLYSRQTSSLWPVVSEGVTAVAYPG
ncbi:LpqB family beta-propeller domain-containing protein [Isoptericola sp. NEAU-Y5]|uniref:LpqB family beta-propeller domain-containing protein n=1 Tax=Isoptericola luteus TaxID=2879484 RepID=A0ABS7ZHZ0_9MICO|nr:LpqB family beta-propeller domain-containing protein [Isoptericola sp. NEAU-Y5]MCA5894638.1 LpqB family beta-propeller domain-containing protein [Isoptericola sp. NEAU-Y5]